MLKPAYPGRVVLQTKYNQTFAPVLQTVIFNTQHCTCVIKPVNTYTIKQFGMGFLGD